ncbi:tape measure protein [Pseudomonas lundensis]|uniref:tape measure protein n=1 Tax=Pseudomonas lundensis TaxID=86185 RepID=UPI001474189A|nr:tape measure protein [Pseudomonas lundensis]NNA24885.1 tape measure protein [Pseudomonas lundensis]
MAAQTLRKLIVSVSAETGAYQREMARAGRMGQSYFRTITSGNRQAADGWRSQQAAIAAQNTAVSSLTSSVSNYASVMVGALAVGNLVHQADAWNSINARLKLATSSTEEFQFAQQSLFDISQRTTTSFADNANLYTRSARALKEFGYSTKESVQFTEALATSFQLSGSSAEEVTSVTTQLSQALAKGVLRGQDFNSVSQSGGRAMVALADGMGVTTGALKAMADNGLLTTDKLVTALIGQLGTLREEYKQMPSTFSGSMQVLSNAFQSWVGGADSSTGSTQALSKAIVFVAENMDSLSATVLTVGASYAGLKVGQFSKMLLEQAVAWRATNAAAIGQTRAQLDVAAAAARRTAANVFAAEAEVTATRFTDAHTAALSRLRLARLADQQATLAQTQAQAANNAATAMVGRAGRGLLGILGGPAGLAIAAGTVAASFLLFSDNAEKAGNAAVDLKRPIEELRKEWEALGAAQRRPILEKLTQEQAEAKKRAADILKDMQAIAQGPTGDYTGAKNFQANQYQRAAASGNFRRGIQGGIDIDSATQNLVQNIKPTAELTSKLQALAGEYQSNIDKIYAAGTQMSALTSVMNNAKSAAEGLGSGLNAIKPPDASVTDAWMKRIDALKEKTEKLKDPTELGEVNRLGAKQGLAQTPEGLALLAQAQAAAKAADASELAKKSQEEVSRKAKQAADDSVRQAKQLDENYSRTLRTLHEQADVHATKTELAKIEFETSKGTLSKLDAAKKIDLQRAAIAVDNLNTQKSYKDLMSDVQRQEDSLLATTRKRFAELAKLNAQGGLTSDQYRKGADAISKASVGKNTSPTFTGLDSSIGGAGGELIKVAEADKALAKWHEKELQRQKELHDQKLITEQQYLDRKFEINEENNKKLESIQDAYKLGSIAVFADLTSNAADMMKQMAGEGSAAYKVLFLASKAAAIAQTMVSTEVAATKALELGPIMGIPAASLIRGLGYASVGMIAATAVAGFSEGGYTGAGGKYEPKGVVHGGEVVIRKEVVDQPGMKDYLIGLNRSGKPGYASGGFVGSSAMSPAFTAPTVAVGVGGGAAPQINLHINSDGSGGSVNAPDAYEQMGLALLATARAEMPNIARSVIQKEKGQNGLLDPNNRRNS